VTPWTDARVHDLLTELTRRDPACLVPVDRVLCGPGYSTLGYVLVGPGAWSAEELEAFYEEGRVLVLCGQGDRPMVAVVKGGTPPSWYPPGVK
jgi:hypothetical protein